MIVRPAKAYRDLFVDFGFEIVHDEVFTQAKNDIAETVAFVLKIKNPGEYARGTLVKAFNDANRATVEFRS